MERDLKLPVSRDDKKSLNSTLCFLRGISASDLVGWLIKTDRSFVGRFRTDAF